MLALDIDGTILDRTGLLRDVVRDAVADISSSGVRVMLATGRSSWNGVRELVAALDLPGIHITMQGAVIGDPVTGRIERSRELSPAVYRDALRFAREHRLEPVVGMLDGHRAVRVPDGVDFLAAAVEGPDFRHAPDLDRLADEVPMRVFLPTTADAHSSILDVARRWFGTSAAIVWSDLTGIEVLAAGTNKGEAVETVARAMGVGLSAVAAVGDASNDTEMLRMVGRSAAMGGAPAHVRAAADISVPSSNDDGILAAFAWFFPDLGPRWDAVDR